MQQKQQQNKGIENIVTASAVIRENNYFKFKRCQLTRNQLRVQFDHNVISQKIV